MLNPDIIEKLHRAISGELKTDPITRVLYSTDASIHKIEPLGVVFPRTVDEIASIVEICAQNGIPIIPRGSGSGLAGQAIGKGLIIDCSRYTNQLLDIDPQEKIALVEPGIVLDDFNREVKRYGLQFGPDPASSERATIGGCIGNNAAGAHSILYGMTADHLLSAEVVLADGTVTTFQPVSLEFANRYSTGEDKTSASDLEKQIYHVALQIRSEYVEEIKRNWPHTWRRASGYNLNYLIPWSPNFPPQWDQSQLPYPPVGENMINLSPLLAGSEGTLAVIRTATVRLVPLKKHTVLCVINFASITEACHWVTSILELSPSAVELVPQSLIRLARSVPAYANLLNFVVGDPAAMLVVEFSGDEEKLLENKIARLIALHAWVAPPYVADSPLQQKQVWDVRKVGLGILMGRLGDAKPISFIEDMSVPVEKLGEFIRELEVIFQEYGTEADFYGHASAGCLHIRPLINVKTTQGRQEMRAIAQAAVDVVIRLGGAVSAEHGDGITRGEWIERAYGPQIISAFKELKQAADPNGVLNPGKIVNPPRMDSSLRYDDDYHSVAWTPVLAFASDQADPARLAEAIEQCNGAGVCRKSSGVMCPSFQATKNEMFSTRGRANLLRALISSGFDSQGFASHAVKESLELCLACKGCKAECPSSVDMAKLKYEFYQHYYTMPGHHHPLRDYVFGYIADIARIGQPVAPLVNYLVTAPWLGGMRAALLGLSKQRTLPKLSRVPLHSTARNFLADVENADCLLLVDAFTEYYYPETGLEALNVLSRCGLKVKLLSTLGAGRTLISKGFLRQAKKHAEQLVEEIQYIDPVGSLPVIGLEPSEIYTLKDEYLDLFPGSAYVKDLSERAWMIDEFLLRPGQDGLPWISKCKLVGDVIDTRTIVLVHGHCYQKAQPPANDGYPTGVQATTDLLKKVGYAVQLIDDGCCGMAGAFGYEREHYEVSMQVGELALLPAISRSDIQHIAAAGISCQAQILDGSGRQAVHPITLVARRSAPAAQ